MSSGEKIIDNEKMLVKRLTLGPLGTNAYVVVCRQTNQSALVDAPAEAKTLQQELQDTSPRYILLTHSHPDHVGALTEMKEKLDVPLGAHREEGANLPVTPDFTLDEGETIIVGNLQLSVLHTPGHTPGSICFRVGDVLLAGDTLFPGGPGKTFSPEGFQQILDSITQKIFTLPGETLVMPGHGDPTKVEKAREDYQVFAAKTRPESLYGDVEWLS